MPDACFQPIPRDRLLSVARQCGVLLKLWSSAQREETRSERTRLGQMLNSGLEELQREVDQLQKLIRGQPKIEGALKDIAALLASPPSSDHDETVLKALSATGQRLADAVNAVP